MKLKITCLCPKGKAGEAIITFEKYLSLVKKPIESKIINEESFHFVYDCKDDRELAIFTTQKIPKTVKRIRDTYWLIIHIVSRANKLISNGNWAAEKALKWANKMFEKKTQKEDVDKFFKDINLEDKDKFIEFLNKEIISWEVLE